MVKITYTTCVKNQPKAQGIIKNSSMHVSKKRKAVTKVFVKPQYVHCPLV